MIAKLIVCALLFLYFFISALCSYSKWKKLTSGQVSEVNHHFFFANLSFFCMHKDEISLKKGGTIKIVHTPEKRYQRT